MRDILTARLELRPCTAADLDDLWQLWIDPDVRRYLWDDQVIPRERAEATLAASLASAEQSGVGLWTVRQRGDESVIGFCGLSPAITADQVELLFGLAPTCWGRGLATEAARAAVRYAFEELGVSRVVASTDRPNRASIRVLEKVGLTAETSEAHGDQPLAYFQLARAGYVPDVTPGGIGDA